MRHVGLDEAWRDRVCRHSELAQLQREGLGEANQSSFGCGVVGLAAISECGGRGDVDDATPLRLRHMGLGCPGHQESTAQVNIHDGIPVGGAHLEDQVIPDDAGAVDQHRDRSKLGDSLLHCSNGGPFVGDVRANGDRTTAIFDDLFCRTRAALLIKINHTNRHAVGGESMSEGGPNAARRTGDNCNSHG